MTDFFTAADNFTAIGMPVSALQNATRSRAVADE
ncbi:hypothetical protein C7374_103319 [Falsochrobactrum ovis]|uniref:Uncharacterized protein n=1 Tax=Falsochrobactrum ovis TaxID=1293442 RepID=A0A364JX08_9HYPH|nr:hypothetical protein C7374_103319 [Falsochrobactrum ovis]